MTGSWPNRSGRWTERLSATSSTCRPATRKLASASPLLVFLHGSGESGDGDKFALAKLTRRPPFPNLISAQQMARRPALRRAVAATRGRSAVVLHGVERDHDFLIVRAGDTTTSIPSRVYLTGLSCGAIGLWNYLDEHSDEVDRGGRADRRQRTAAPSRARLRAGGACRSGRSTARRTTTSPIEGEVYPLTFLQCMHRSVTCRRSSDRLQVGWPQRLDETYGPGRRLRHLRLAAVAFASRR